MSITRVILSILLLSSSVLSVAQDATRISGQAPDLLGHTAYLYGYHDFISESKVLLDSTTITEDGDFELSFSSDEIQYVLLVSDYISANLYTQPGTLYNIELPLPDSDQPKAFGRKAKTEVIFNNLDLNDINALIIDFNYNYELFFQSNYETLRKLFAPRNYASLTDSTSRPSSAVSSVNQLFDHTSIFSARMDSLYLNWDTPYFKLYRSAVLGDLMMNSSATPREIYEKYIEPFPFNPQHPEFTRLHERFYKFYLARYAQSYGEEKLYDVLNIQGDYSALKDLFSKDDFLEDIDRMDVVIIYAIEEVWASNAMKHASLSQVLETMSTNGSSDKTRSMAQVMFDKLTALKKGFAPKDFEFEDQFKDSRHISDFIGKPLLIEFWSSWCSQCAIEKEHLASLTKRYKDVVQVLSVEVTEPGSDPMIGQEHDEVIHTNTPSQSDWISSYQVLSLPTYVLIDSEGKVMRDHCPLPSEGLEAILHKIQADKTSENKRNVGRKDK